MKEFSTFETWSLRMWAMLAVFTFLWFAIDGGITIVYALRADTILKAEIVRGLLQVFMAGLWGVAVYFGGFLISTFVYYFLKEAVKGFRRKHS